MARGERRLREQLGRRGGREIVITKKTAPPRRRPPYAHPTRSGPCRDAANLQLHGLQMKFAASSVSPRPLYTATSG
jgi:hypothetical protein